jgi:hypothetical protein
MIKPVQTGIVDRFEGDFAVIELETGKTLNVPKFLLEPVIQTGDCIYSCQPDNSTLYVHPQPIWKLDSEKTNERREQVQTLTHNVMPSKVKKRKEK